MVFFSPLCPTYWGGSFFLAFFALLTCTLSSESMRPGRDETAYYKFEDASPNDLLVMTTALDGALLRLSNRRTTSCHVGDSRQLNSLPLSAKMQLEAAGFTSRSITSVLLIPHKSAACLCYHTTTRTTRTTFHFTANEQQVTTVQTYTKYACSLSF